MRRRLLSTAGLHEQVQAAVRAEEIGSPGGEWQSALHRRLLVSTRLLVSDHAGLLKHRRRRHTLHCMSFFLVVDAPAATRARAAAGASDGYTLHMRLYALTHIYIYILYTAGDYKSLEKRAARTLYVRGPENDFSRVTPLYFSPSVSYISYY